mgnify:CR=1 FL=1
MQQDYLQIGEIVRPQGIRGEVKLRAMTEDMTRYARQIGRASCRERV